MMRFFLACLVFLASFAITVFPVSARYDFGSVTGGQINEALANTTKVRFLPDNPIYFLIRVKESVSRFFKASSRDRAQFDYVISSKRLKEAYLLMEKRDEGAALKSLDAYSQALAQTGNQLVKARSQNQEVVPVVEKIAGNLDFEQTLLIAIGQMSANMSDSSVWDIKTEAAVNSFGEFVANLDKIKPGISNRFMILKAKDFEPAPPLPLVSPTPLIETSASAKPRKVIY